MMRRVMLAIAAAATLAACETPNQTTRDLDHLARDYQQSEQTAPQNVDDATRADICGASHFANLVGQPASSINRDTLPPRTRIISPEQMVTQDFVAARLNIRVGPDGKVTMVQCF
ncbi:MAG: I78 family peptidase inhibitor [Terricaulis sp.]